MKDILAMILGMACAGVGGELFVRASVGLAAWARISPALIWSTIAAFATSGPEFAVAVSAALGGAPQIALGDSLVSNVVNIALVLALALSVSGIQSPRSGIKRDFPLALVVPIFTGLLFLDGTLSRFDGLLLLGLFTAWLASTVLEVKSQRLASAADVKARRGWPVLLLCAAGLVFLFGAGALVVSGAKGLAVTLGIDNFVVGTTVVAVGAGSQAKPLAGLPGIGCDMTGSASRGPQPAFATLSISMGTIPVAMSSNDAPTRGARWYFPEIQGGYMGPKITTILAMLSWIPAMAQTNLCREIDHTAEYIYSSRYRLDSTHQYIDSAAYETIRLFYSRGLLDSMIIPGDSVDPADTMRMARPAPDVVRGISRVQDITIYFNPAGRFDSLFLRLRDSLFNIDARLDYAYLGNDTLVTRQRYDTLAQADTIVYGTDTRVSHSAGPFGFDSWEYCWSEPDYCRCYEDAGRTFPIEHYFFVNGRLVTEYDGAGYKAEEFYWNGIPVRILARQRAVFSPAAVSGYYRLDGRKMPAALRLVPGVLRIAAAAVSPRPQSSAEPTSPALRRQASSSPRLQASKSPRTMLSRFFRIKSQ